jgi:hypothetical protein
VSALVEIKPSTRQRVMDLVQAAGLDVTDWANYRGGAAKAATNPKYPTPGLLWNRALSSSSIFGTKTCA